VGAEGLQQRGPGRLALNENETISNLILGGAKKLTGLIDRAQTGTEHEYPPGASDDQVHDLWITQEIQNQPT